VAYFVAYFVIPRLLPRFPFQPPLLSLIPGSVIPFHSLYGFIPLEPIVTHQYTLLMDKLFAGEHPIDCEE
jgi:hypothetical protein